MNSTAKEKYEFLKKILSSKEKIAVAYSGGADSALLSAIAASLPGTDAVGIFLNSPLVPEREYESAIKTAEEIGILLIVVDFDPLFIDGFSKNQKKRCYLCKKEMMKIIKGTAEQNGISDIADGLNASDISEFRPGIPACEEEGVWHPFVDADITKKEIREISRSLGFSFADKPSSACLASRIPYGDLITAEKLKIIESAEELLFSLCLSTVRVRAHGDIARIETSIDDFEKILKNRELIAGEFKKLGFSYICLDVEGFRSGSLDRP